MARQTRRQFLEDSMFATAAAVGASSLAPAAIAADQPTSSSERLGVAVVGVRGRGGSHIGAFAGRKDTQILWICDADEEVGMKRVAEVAKRQGSKPRFAQDIRTVLEDSSVDVVSIATPNHWHALGAIWAIQAGKDVYVEKPVSHNVSEGARIVEAARKYEKICQTGTQSRSNTGMQQAMEFVQSGKIGKVKVARGLCYKPRGSIGERGKYDPPKGVDYSLWLGPAEEASCTRPKFHYDWHWQWPYGNGDLGNQGIHQMDLARWGLGVDRLSDSVISYGGRFGYTDAGDTANTQVVVHDYGDRALVFEVRGLKTGDYRGAKIGVIFECTEGYLVMASYSSGVAFDTDGKQIAKFTGGGDHFGNFVSAVRSRQHSDLHADIQEGHLSSALCHLGNISYRLGTNSPRQELIERVASVSASENAKATLERTLEHLEANGVDSAEFTMGPHLPIDPKTETFRVDNAEATAMLTREYRKPFVVPAKGQV